MSTKSTKSAKTEDNLEELAGECVAQAGIAAEAAALYARAAGLCMQGDADGAQLAGEADNLAAKLGAAADRATGAERRG